MASKKVQCPVCGQIVGMTRGRPPRALEVDKDGRLTGRKVRQTFGPESVTTRIMPHAELREQVFKVPMSKRPATLYWRVVRSVTRPCTGEV